jgi:uncharacterized membrane protein YoaK (UPF0700 family)
VSRELVRRWPSWPELARRLPARAAVAGPGSGPGPRDDEAARRAGERRRDLSVVVLTLAAGALDAAAFLRLGHVFSSVITGNLVLLGISAGQGNGTLALNGGLALGGYAAGVLAGAALAGTPTRSQPAWPRRVTAALAAELGVMVVFGGLWLAVGSRPAGGAQLALLILAGAAMGMQSAAVRRLGEMSATYMTSTLTGVITALAVGPWPPPHWPRNVGVLAAMVTGGLFGALAAVQSPAWVPAAVVVPVAAVLAVALRR